jgi:hypothetical protein
LYVKLRPYPIAHERCTTKWPGRVDVRCDRCARDLGQNAPILVMCVYDAHEGLPEGLSPWWSLVNLGHRSRRKGSPGKEWRRRDPHSMHRSGARGFELHCRRCFHRPRISRRKLYELAERALAAGRCDAYV